MPQLDDIEFPVETDDINAEEHEKSVDAGGWLDPKPSSDVQSFTSEQAEHSPSCQAAREFLELVELAGQIAAADERPDGCAGDHVDLDTGLVERPQNADMGPAASRAAAERQRDARFARRLDHRR